jgi:HK97 gp10 family phage protein
MRGATVDVDNKPINPAALAAVTRMPQVSRQVRGVAVAIRRDARRLVQKRSGRLRRNIDIERVVDPRTGAVTYIVGWTRDGFYGRFLELGTEHARPYPHLVPAAIMNGAVAPTSDGAV